MSAERPSKTPLDALSIESLLEAAQACMARQDWAGAWETWGRVAERFPERLDGPYGRGKVLIELGKTDQAEEAFRKLIQDFPEAPHGRLGLARSFASAGKFEQASSELELVVQNHAGLAEGKFQLGETLLELNKVDRAIDLFKLCLCEPMPYSAAAFHGLCRAYHRKRDLASARQLSIEFFSLQDAFCEAAATVKVGLVLGESHIGAIKEAADLQSCSWLSFQQLPRVPIIDSSGQLAQEYRTLAEQNANFSACFLSVGGNEHTTIGLATHPVPFTLGGTSVDQGRRTTYLSNSLVQTMIDERMRAFETTVRFLATILPSPTYLVETPPPCPDSDHIIRVITKTVDPQLSAAVAARGILNKYDRLKLWNARSAFLRRLAEELSMGFVPAPDESRDAEGFLRKECWSDATHGNEIYGSHVVGQILKLLGGVR